MGGGKIRNIYGGKKLLDKVLIVLGIILVIFSVFSAIDYSKSTYLVEADTNSWLEQADAATTPIQQAEYLEKAKQGFVKHNITTGYDTWWYPTASNSMAVKIERIDDTIAYAKEVQAVPKQNEQAYKNAYEILQGKIDGLQGINGVDAYLVKIGKPFWDLEAYGGIILGFALLIIGAGMWLGKE